MAKELGLDELVIVTAGIHDSNASLLPYIARGSDKDFILNSTGTWCVCMHPDVSENVKSFYNPDDIGKTVFFNRSALDTPVKTAIFVGGTSTSPPVTSSPSSTEGIKSHFFSLSNAST